MRHRRVFLFICIVIFEYVVRTLTFVTCAIRALRYNGLDFASVSSPVGQLVMYSCRRVCLTPTQGADCIIYAIVVLVLSVEAPSRQQTREQAHVSLRRYIVFAAVCVFPCLAARSMFGIHCVCQVTFNVDMLPITCYTGLRKRLLDFALISDVWKSVVSSLILMLVMLQLVTFDKVYMQHVQHLQNARRRTSRIT